jgi:hypothetical protein
MERKAEKVEMKTETKNLDEGEHDRKREGNKGSCK